MECRGLSCLAMTPSLHVQSSHLFLTCSPSSKPTTQRLHLRMLRSTPKQAFALSVHYRIHLASFLKNYTYFVIKSCQFYLCKIYQILLHSTPTAIVCTQLYRSCFSLLIFASLTESASLVLLLILTLPSATIYHYFGLRRCSNILIKCNFKINVQFNWLFRFYQLPLEYKKYLSNLEDLCTQRYYFLLWASTLEIKIAKKIVRWRIWWYWLSIRSTCFVPGIVLTLKILTHIILIKTQRSRLSIKCTFFFSKNFFKF